MREYDYSQVGSYFITVCTKNRQEILGNIIVGADVLDGPIMQLSDYGELIEQQIESMNQIYQDVSIAKYIVMPNHIHLIIEIYEKNDGSSRTSTPTHAEIPRLISTLKRFVNKKIGWNIWQRSFHDHIIRNEREYQQIWEYIDTNPQSWLQDCFYRKKDAE